MSARIPSVNAALRYIETHVIPNVAQTGSTLLVRGETGSGKEAIASMVHQAGRRKSGPFRELNCAAIVDSLVADTFFGHKKGAFTGADANSDGKFRAANGGVLFLDEVGELTPAGQCALLRALESRTIDPLGSNESVEVDVQIVAATNRNLAEEVRAKRFRMDLYFRLAVVEVTIPPLRERRDDLPLLMRHFASKYATEFGRRLWQPTDEDIAAFRSYSWPGNVRELAHVIERACALDELPQVPHEDSYEPVAKHDALPTLKLEDLELLAVKEAMNRTGGNKSAAATILGITRSTLDRKLATPPRVAA